MANVTERKANKRTSNSGSVRIGRSEAQKVYEAEIDKWVRGRASLEDVFRKDPFVYKPSFNGFFHFLFTGSTKKH